MTGVQEREQKMQVSLNWLSCYFHGILLSKQVKRPGQESRLVVLWPIKLKTLWGFCMSGIVHSMFWNLYPQLFFFEAWLLSGCNHYYLGIRIMWDHALKLCKSPFVKQNVYLDIALIPLEIIRKGFVTTPMSWSLFIVAFYFENL